MKRNIFLFVSCILSLSFLTFSCSDDDNDGIFPGGTSAKLLPTVIKGEKGIFESYYQYDSRNRLISKKDVWPRDGKRSSTYEVSYDTEGRISKMVQTDSKYTADNRILTYVYDGSKVTVQSDNPAQADFIVEIDDQGKVLKFQSAPNEGSSSYTENYDYDTNGNIKGIQKSGRKYRSYRYDNKNGIFKHINMPQWFIVTQLNELYMFNNNITEEIVSDSSQEKAELRGIVDEGYKITYVYNENGYPRRYNHPYVTDIMDMEGEDNYNIEYKEAD